MVHNIPKQFSLQILHIGAKGLFVWIHEDNAKIHSIKEDKFVINARTTDSSRNRKKFKQ